MRWAKCIFPGFSVEAVKVLIDRKVSGLGCDTLSVDYGASSDYPVHHLGLGAGIYNLENLADLSELPETGAFLIVAPIKLEGGSGGPVRVFALLSNATKSANGAGDGRRSRKSKHRNSGRERLEYARGKLQRRQG